METKARRKALLDVEEMMNVLGTEIEKMSWCREILEDAVLAGGRTGERYGEGTNEMGLCNIMTDVEKGFWNFKILLYGMLKETESQETAEDGGLDHGHENQASD